MKLLLIYGPEASGKSTVGAELAALTGWPLLTNHAMLDVALRFHGHDDGALYDLAWTLRRALFDFERRRGRAGVIATWAYSLPHSARHWPALQAFCAERTIDLLPVRLSCPAALLRERVGAPGRAAAGKVSTPALLERLLADNDYAALPGIASLAIDSGRLTARAAAAEIARHHLEGMAR